MTEAVKRDVDMGLAMRKPDFGICEQQSAQSDLRLYFHHLERTIAKLAICKILKFWLASVAEQA